MLFRDEYTYDRDQIPGLAYWGGHYWEWYQVSSLERGACFIDSLRTNTSNPRVSNQKAQ